MPSGQLEGKIVFERLAAETIHAIVAIEAGIAIRQGMSYGEGDVHLTVTGLAGVRGEDRDVAVMTVIAGERYIQRRALVSFQ